MSKDASKIPKKRLFEMRKKLYLIQFKVEGVIGPKDEGEDNDGDDNDDVNGEDKGLEDFDHDLNPEQKRTPGDNKGDKSSSNSTGPFSTPAGSKKVLDWVSLFQNSEESKKLEASEFGQYSCAQLLREMEATLTESEEEGLGIIEDDELVKLPESLLERAMEIQKGSSLPENLYVLPDIDEMREQDHPKRGVVENSDQETLVNKKKWGPILVEKRPSRHQLDGKTIMEKAQERKKKANLDGCKGGCLGEYEISVAAGATDVEMLEDPYSTEDVGWLRMCHQRPGDLDLTTREVTMLHADT